MKIEFGYEPVNYIFLQEDPVATLREELKNSQDLIIELLQKPMSKSRVDILKRSGGIPHKPSEPRTKNSPQNKKEALTNQSEKPQAVKEVPRKEIPPIPRKEIPPIPRKEIPPIPRKEVPPIPRKEVPPIPRKEVPPIPRKEVPPIPRKEIPPIRQKLVHEQRESVMTQDAAVETEHESGVSNYRKLPLIWTPEACIEAT